MRGILLRLAVGGGALLVVLQLIPSPIRPLAASTLSGQLDLQLAGTAQVGAILDRACRDCHSNRTHVPWYGHIAPVSWMLARDINRGRKKLDLSDWQAHRHTANEMEELCDAVSNGSMPLKSYKLIHREARLTKGDVDAICDWAVSQQGTGPHGAGTSVVSTGPK
jgi:hypothetical protein